MTLSNGTTIVTSTLARLTYFTTEVFLDQFVAEAKKEEIESSSWAREVSLMVSLFHSRACKLLGGWTIPLPLLLGGGDA